MRMSLALAVTLKPFATGSPFWGGNCLELVQHRPANRKVPNTKVMLTFGRTLRKLDREIVLSGESYTNRM